jgi:CheY-like chemotaxis protein
VNTRVLVVDDSPAILKGLTSLFEQFGCAVRGVTNGSDALAALSETDFDLIFLDCLMPGMDGLEVARAIRRLDGPRGRVRIIGMAVKLLGMNECRCRDAGMDDCFEKLADAAMFEAMLRRWRPPDTVPAEGPAAHV